MIMTIVFLIAAHRSSIVLVALFVFLTLCFLFLGLAKFYHEIAAINTVDGVLGILTSIVSLLSKLQACEPLTVRRRHSVHGTSRSEGRCPRRR